MCKCDPIGDLNWFLTYQLSDFFSRDQVRDGRERERERHCKRLRLWNVRLFILFSIFLFAAFVFLTIRLIFMPTLEFFSLLPSMILSLIFFFFISLLRVIYFILFWDFTTKNWLKKKAFFSSWTFKHFLLDGRFQKKSKSFSPKGWLFCRSWEID